MKETWLKMKDWWRSLALREKRIVTLGMIFISFFILYVSIWSPLLNQLSAMRAKIKTQEKTLAFLQMADREIANIKNEGSSQQKTLSPVSLLSTLQKQIRSAHLDQSLIQMKQASQNTVELQFEKVEFDAFLKMLLSIIQEERVSVSQLSVTASATPGIVTASVVFKI